MKKTVLALSLFVAQSIHASPPVHFPTWLTDDKAKVWALNQLVNFMKDDKFYKISAVSVKQSFDSINHCDRLQATLTFDDSTCKGRQVVLVTWALLCGDSGCKVESIVTDCQPSSATLGATGFFEK